MPARGCVRSRGEGSLRVSLRDLLKIRSQSGVELLQGRDCGFQVRKAKLKRRKEVSVVTERRRGGRSLHCGQVERAIVVDGPHDAGEIARCNVAVPTMLQQRMLD